MDIRNNDTIRKKQFFVFINICMIPAVIFLNCLNYFRGETHDFVIDLFFFLILAVNLFTILRFNADLLVYRVSLFLGFTIGLYILAIGSGYGSSLYAFLTAPVLFFFFFEKNEGQIWAAIFLIFVGILVLFPSLFGTYSYDLYHRIGFSASLLLLTGIGYGVETNRSRYCQLLAEERDHLAHETRQLQKAIAEIKTLNGMLPICSHCKKIRDDKGYWQQVEAYIHDHSGAEFSHGICPDCSKKYYAGEAEEAADEN